MQHDSSGAQPALWVGTSGWVYRHWNGLFYPQGLPGNQQLAYYSERFQTVEINYSFYHLPERSVFEAWRAGSPPDFLFAVKASRYLTHMKKLKEPEEPLQRLLERATGLGSKLGPILFQFPHQWRVNLDRLSAFLAALQAFPGHRYAFEFRHTSWLVEDVYALLNDAGAALCLPVHPEVPLDVRLTAPWTYIRFHGGRYGVGYSDEELDEWAAHIRGFRGSGADVYAYFNNDWGGHAIWDANRLLERLEPASGRRAA